MQTIAMNVQTLTLPLPNGEAAAVWLLSGKLVYLPDCQTLLAADLHWGKTQTFRQHGIPIPLGVLEADLQCLSEAIIQTGAKRLLVLGDLVHHKKSLTPQVIETVAQWRNSPPLAALAIALVKGNHDRHWKTLPADWRIDIHPGPLREGPWAFDHEPEPVPGHYLWAGHIHPVVRLSSPTDRLRLPCFALGRNVGLLPSFSLFTGGFNIQPEDYEAVYVIAEARVISIRAGAGPGF